MSPVTSSLRIALVSLHTSPGAEPGSGDAGGMNVVVRHQAEAMAALGHQVEILTRRSSPEMPTMRRLSPGVTLRYLDAGPLRSVPKGDHEGFIDEFRVRASSLGPWDVIHSHHWFSGMAMLPLARELGVPHVQSFHSIAADEATPLSDGERPESGGRMAGEAWLARESDLIVAISAAEADTVVQRLGGSMDRIVVVPPGVDGAMFHPLGAAVTPVAGANARGYAVVAGRLQPLKGLDLAIEALAAVPAGLRPELVIAGDASADYDGYIDELTRLAARHGIARQVRFVGPCNRVKLAGLMRGARVVLVPSHSETFGLVALEAAASGVPVIAQGTGGLREAVIDGDTGLLVESRDPQDWADALTAVLSDAALARRLSLAARRRAEEFDWPRSAAHLLEVYCTLLPVPVCA
ncbi:glycosyltransferase [Cryobacterium soli]|uniref:glycosyltransferase n=1 Tax=Cryobacterium soli TaxID=2220095 RepID=UPI001FE8C246|nr:glycosyltransferase [Cryobacterium soli]